MILKRSRLWRNQYWIEDAIGQVVTSRFKILEREKHGNILKLNVLVGYCGEIMDYILTVDKLYIGSMYSPVYIDKVNDMCYVITEGSISQNRQYSTYSLEGNLISHNMRVYNEVVDGLIKVECKNKLGYMDKDLNWVIEPKFIRDVLPFNEGVALVEIEKNVCVFINTKGEFLSEPFNCSSVKAMPDKDIFIVELNHLLGVVNAKGEVILPAIYESIKKTGGYYIVCKNGGFGLTDRAGNSLLECIYDKIFEFDDKFVVREYPTKEIRKQQILK